MTLPISFEFFPPKTPEGVAKLRGVRQQLYALAPEFCSVTYGAGGSTQAGTFAVVAEMLAEGAQADVPERLAGVANLDVAGTLLLGASDGVVGEDVYAASAYTGERPRLGGLAVQDGLRVALALAMLVGLALRLAKLGGG